MNSLSIFDELDQAIDRLLADPQAPTSDLGTGIAELLEIAPDMRDLPRPDFKTRLMVELEWQASGRAISSTPVIRTATPQEDLNLLAALSGETNSVYPVRGVNFVASVAVHAAMLLFIGIGLVMVKGTARVAEQRVTGAARIDAYIAPVGSRPNHGGGGAGSADKVGASKGKAPRFAQEQFTPPTVEIEDHTPKLPVEATLIGPPELHLPQAQTGDPLSNLVALSNGVGVGGIGSGRGTGDGPGSGSGRGPGSGGGVGGDFYLPGNGVTAPRAIYSPEPEFSDEARAAKYQGVVVLLAIIGPDGRPRNLQVARSLGMGLDEKAIEAVRNWRFEPGRKDGHPVAVQIAVEVDFHIL